MAICYPGCAHERAAEGGNRGHVSDGTSRSPIADQAIAPIEVPREPALNLLKRTVVARGLRNPRGLHVAKDGSLLVSEAGTGDPKNELSGALLRMRDTNGDGDFDDEGERQLLLGDQPSRNILDIVRRDEVFGMAGIAAGGGKVLVSLAFFGGPSIIFSVSSSGVNQWGSTHNNINDLTYDPQRKTWYGAASTTDEVVRLLEGGRAERVIKIPTLASGQDAVPGYLSKDPGTGKILVSLFTGSPEGEEGGDGTELVPRAGGIISVDPDARRFEWLVTGLTAPTDLEIAQDGSIYVLEFCDAFLDPLETRQDMYKGPSHGGFKRFSGRLLHIDRKTRQVEVVAMGLDAPTNLALSAGALFVAEGMGTPGRSIPGPEGPQPLEGFIEKLLIP